MEMWLSLAAAAFCICFVVWKLSRGHDAGARLGGHRGHRGLWLLVLVLAPPCCFVSPVTCGLVIVSCTFALICVKRRSELLPLQSRAVLVTGCDSGFGHALVRRLSVMGVKVFAGVLDVNGAGAQSLIERASDQLQVLQLDVTDSTQIQSARQHICTQLGDTGLWGLVNNAGILHCPADAEICPLSTCRRCMEVNFLAAVNMCQVFLPLLRQSRGRIVNVASMAAEVPMPLFAAYGASKAALSLFSRVMRLELSRWDISVSLIQPAGFRTNLFGTSDDIRRYRDEMLAAVSPEVREDYGEAYISSLPDHFSTMSRDLTEDLSPVLDDMCHALLSADPRPVYTPGQMGWLLPFLHRHCPTAIFDFIIMTFSKYSDSEPAGLRTT